MNDVMISMVAAECHEPVKKAAGLKAKLRAAMSAAHNHWMVMDKDMQLRGAIAAVLLDVGVDSEDGKRLVTEYEMLRKLSAFLAAAQAGLTVEPPTPPDGHEPIGIMELWNETRKG